MLKLVSFSLCPFVQRSRILLNEKGTDYDIEYINLEKRPDWFLERVPTGRVPALFIGDATLFESAAINEYIDETQGEPLLAKDPILRARQRALIAFSEEMIFDQYRMFSTDNQESFEANKQQLLDKLKKLSNEKVDQTPQSMSLLDAAIAPLFFRMKLVPSLYADLQAIYADQPSMMHWIDSLLSRDSVIASVKEDFKQEFMAFFAARNSVAISA